jgi:N-ethylmaleimide reductase
MIRCRTIGNIPNDLRAEYYDLRSAAELIITEDTPPLPIGSGMAEYLGY